MLPQPEYALQEALTAAVQSHRTPKPERIAMLQQAIAAAEAVKEPAMDACPQMTSAKQALELLQPEADLEAGTAQSTDDQKLNVHPHR
jgi:hypothetical protein